MKGIKSKISKVLCPIYCITIGGIHVHHQRITRARLARLAGLAVIIAGQCFINAPVLAQGDSREAAESVRSEAREQVSRTSSGLSLSERAEALQGSGYADVMAAPDDPALNLRYVKDLIAKGNVQLAAATTERILLLYPEADDVRLLYAILLYRMDVLDDAAVQLDILEMHEPSPAIRAEIARYRDLIKQRLNPLRRSAAISIGMHYDTNRNTFPDKDTFLVLDTPIRLTTGDGEVDDWGRLAIGSAQISKDTGRQSLQQVFGDVALLYDDQVEVDALDVNALLLNTGFLYRTIYGDLIPRAHASWIELDSKKYSRDYGLSLRGERPLFKSKIKAFAQVTTGWRRYNNTTDLPFSSEQDGNYQRVEIGGDRQIDATTGLRLAAAYNNNDADLAYEGYDGFDLAASLTKILPRGTFLLASVSFEKQFYDGNDPFISAKKREDRDWKLDLTYGAPVATAIGVFSGNPMGPEMLREIVLNLTAGFEDSHSNIPNYQYKNYRLQFMFNRNWDF